MRLREANNIFLSSSFFIFITRFFPQLASLMVAIWFSRHLPVELYGRYQDFWIHLNILWPLACFGIHQLVITYSKGMLASIVSRIKTRKVVVFLLWMLLPAIAFGVLQYRSGGASVITSVLFLITFSLSILSEAILIVFRRFRILWVANLLYALAFCAAHWLALNGNFSLKGIFSVLLIVSFMRLFIYCVGILTEIRKDEDGYEDQEPEMNAVTKLWFHLGVYDVSQMLFSWIDKFVISLLLTAGVSAIYYNGAQNIPFLPLLLGATGSAALLQLANSPDGNEKDNTISLVNQKGRILSNLVFPAFFFLYLFRNEIFVNIFGEKYISSIPIFAVSVLALPVRAYSFTTVLQRHHKGSIINAGAIADLVIACGLMYPLYRYMGLPGVALSFVVSTYAQAAFYLIITGKVLGVNPLKLVPWKNWAIKLILFFVLFSFIHYLGEIYFTGRFTLVVGLLVAGGIAVLATFFETFWLRKHGANTKTKVREYR